MAPAVPTKLTSSDKSDTFNVLLTGYGPFCSAKDVNPSWEAVKLVAERGRDFDVSVAHCSNPGLDTRMLSVTKKVHIDICFMPVEYAAVINKVPVFHGREAPRPRSRGDEIDQFDPSRQYYLFLHVGQGRPGGIKIETRGFGHGYKKEDFASKLPPPVVRGEQDSLGYPLAEAVALDGDDSLRTTIDTGSLAERLSQAHPDISIARSDDAGRYLCDFIFFASLAEAIMAARRGEHKGRPLAKVLFVHVSPPDQPLSISQVADVLQSLIAALCESA
jgi:pyroglutamyl-peptidase